MFKGGMAEMLKQAQKVQEQMKEAQEKLAKAEITGSAGANLVTLTLNGKYQAKQISVDDSLLDDKEMLEDLIVAAMNDAVNKINQNNDNQMQNMLGKMNLPDDFKMPL